MKQTKAEREYNALSVADKLKFDASGRPGSKLIEADQRRLQIRYLELRRQHGLLNVHGGPILTEKRKKDSPDFLYQPSNYENPAEWRDNRHKPRRAKVDRFLGQIEAIKSDIDQGSPRELHGLPYSTALGNVVYSPSDNKKVVLCANGWSACYYQTGQWVQRYKRYPASFKVDKRLVVFKRKKAGKVKSVTVALDSWRGNWFYHALALAGLLPQIKADKITLKDGMTKKLRQTVGGVDIYERLLFGVLVDYCAIKDGVTYHAATEKNALIGLERKLSQPVIKPKNPDQIINRSICLRLGFCLTGINAFCAALGIDPTQDYTRQELKKLLANADNRDQLKCTFGYELKKLSVI